MLKTALMCLALTIYFEAGSEPVAAQYAVAETVLNRAQSQNKSICSVALDKKQYSWKHKSVPESKLIPSLKIAEEALRDAYIRKYPKTLYFFKNKRSKTNWYDAHYYATLGKQNFYLRKDKS